MKKIVLFLVFFSFCPLVFAKTIINNDITQNTVWTKDISPIILSRDEEDKNKGFFDIHILNGAELKIEEGVEVVFSDDTSLRVVKSCQKDYFDKCIKIEGSKKYSTIKILGTKEKPVKFTSLNDYENQAGKAGDWGNLELQTQNNEVNYLEMSYGGKIVGGMDYTKYMLVSIEETEFNSLKITDSLGGGVYSERGIFNELYIDKTQGIGINCKKYCQIKDSVIKNNQKEGVFMYVLDNKKPSILENSFIYNNGFNGVFVDGHRDLKITNNLISSNQKTGVLIDSSFERGTLLSKNTFEYNQNGGLYFYYLPKFYELKQNNFYHNKNFAIDTKKETEEKAKIIDSWFGIDSGPKEELGEYYVPKSLEIENFKTEKNLLDFNNKTVLAEIKKYKSDLDLDTRIFNITKSEKNLFGKQKKGGLYQYKFSFSNIKPYKLNKVKIKLSFPDDLFFIKCSFTDKEVKSFNKYCSSKKLDYLFEDNKLVYYTDFKALEQKDVSFLVVKDSFNKELSLEIDYQNNNYPVLFEKKDEFNLYEEKFEKVSQTKTGSEKKITSSKLLRKQKLLEKLRNKRNNQDNKKEENNSNYDIESLAQKFFGKTDLQTNSNWNKMPLEIRKKVYERIQTLGKNKKTGYLKEGLIKTEIYNNQLKFYLLTDKREKYYLYNSKKWENLLSFYRSENKNKKVLIWGEYYVNKYGKKTGINFVKFQVK